MLELSCKVNTGKIAKETLGFLKKKIAGKTFICS